MKRHPDHPNQDRGDHLALPKAMLTRLAARIAEAGTGCGKIEAARVIASQEHERTRG
jgi:hypothetical protein